jgi:HTH-type transcriptional regulator/antitoxin HigA
MEIRVVSKKRLSEKELVEGTIPHTTHSDELAEVKLDELGLEISKSDYKAVLKRIESLFDAAEPGTPEGDELERLVAWVEEYEEKHFPI